MDQPEATQKSPEPHGRTELSDPDSEPADAAAPLGQHDETAETAPTIAEPEIKGTANTVTVSAQPTTPSPETGPVPDLAANKAGGTAVDSPQATDPSLTGVPDTETELGLPTGITAETAMAGGVATTASGAPLSNASGSPPAAVVTASTAPAESSLVSQPAAATMAGVAVPRGGSATPGHIGGDPVAEDGLTDGTGQHNDTTGETDNATYLDKKAAAISPGGAQPGQSAAPTGTGDTIAKFVVPADGGAGEMPLPQDVAPRGADIPAQTAPGTNQIVASTTASAFGSDLKQAGDASFAAETAAARNTPNAAASQVAVQINRAVQDGQDKFVVNLKPANLGKVSVQLEVGHDKRIIAVISAERPDTLELLQRDARTLELALKDAGLQTDSGSLNFSLQGNGSDESPFDNPPGANHNIAVRHDGNDDLDAPPTTNTRAYATDASGVDMHV